MNSRYNFQEGQIKASFGGENLTEFRSLINSNTSFTTLGMPGVGVSYFLRFLAMQNFAYFIHLDMYSLHALTKLEFWKLFLRELRGDAALKSEDQIITDIKEKLTHLAENEAKIVIIFNRFDQLQKEFNLTFFANIRSLRNIASDKITFIFTANKPLYELSPEAISGPNLNFYSKYLYFKPYSKQDLKKLSKFHPNSHSSERLDDLIELSGGHAQLLSVLLNSQKQENLLLDHFVRLQMKELLGFLSYHQKKQVEKIGLGKNLTEVDDYLLGVGLVKKEGSGYRLFTPLLEEYIKTNLPLRLSHNEAKLFKLLRKNEGRIVPEDEIFKEVWGSSRIASDWALDALIYRLRRNPTFSSQYAIESHKKQGFSLISL